MTPRYTKGGETRDGWVVLHRMLAGQRHIDHVECVRPHAVFLSTKLNLQTNANMKTRKVRKTTLKCPHATCGRAFISRRPFEKHVETCKNRPSVADVSTIDIAGLAAAYSAMTLCDDVRPRDDVRPCDEDKTCTIKRVFRGHTVRAVNQLDGPLFVANDVYAALDIPALRLQGCDEVVVTIGTGRKISALTEYGAYSVAMASRKPEAAEFKRFLFGMSKDLGIVNTALDLNDYVGLSTIYLLRISSDEFKFGKSGDILRRIAKHTSTFGQVDIVNVWACASAAVTCEVEARIKTFARQNKLLATKFGQTEIIKTQDISTVCVKIDHYVARQNSLDDRRHSDRSTELAITRLSIERDIRRTEVHASIVTTINALIARQQPIDTSKALDILTDCAKSQDHAT